MVDIDDIERLRRELARLERDLLTVEETEAQMGQPVEVEHPLTGETIDVGGVDQEAVEKFREDAQNRLNGIRDEIEAIDFDDISRRKRGKGDERGQGRARGQ